MAFHAASICNRVFKPSITFWWSLRPFISYRISLKGYYRKTYLIWYYAENYTIGMFKRNNFWLMASNCWLKLFLIDCYNSSIKRPNQCFWVNYNTLSSHVLYKICVSTILLWMLMMIIMASVNKFMHIKCITALYTRHLHFNVLPATSVF